MKNKRIYIYIFVIWQITWMFLFKKGVLSAALEPQWQYKKGANVAHQNRWLMQMDTY